MTVLTRYDSLVAAGELRPDPEQRAAATASRASPPNSTRRPGAACSRA